MKHWIGNNATDQTQEGIVLLVEPTPLFYKEDFEEDQKFGIGFISKYVLKYKRFVVQLIIGLLAGRTMKPR